jgi:hypothetical protein
MVYKIFGKNIKLHVQNYQLEAVLLEELRLYPRADDEKIDHEVHLVDKIQLEGTYSTTPSIHTTLDHGFFCDFGVCQVLFTYSNPNRLDIKIAYNTSHRYLSKFRNLAYRSSIENIGQVLHELIFVPLNFFDPQSTIIHASSMKNLQSNRTVMIGGTGGVGKTSLELLLCRELNYSFISDDIAVINSQSLIYPNLAYPKIYAYNVVGNEALKSILFDHRSMMDRVQWSMRKRLRGNSGVRRSIAPNKIFNSIERSENSIDDYYILFKTNEVDTITIEDIDDDRSAKLTLEILKNEYHALFQHITWHEYNCMLMNYKPIVTLESIFSNWYHLYRTIFQEINCYVIKIPLHIEHDIFLKEMRSLFSS